MVTLRLSGLWFVLALCVGAMMSGCMYQHQIDACQKFTEVCEAVKKDGLVRVIVTLDEFADKTAFADDMHKQGMTVHNVFDVTPQIVAQINFGHFLFLYGKDSVAQIQLDKFTIRN